MSVPFVVCRICRRGAHPRIPAWKRGNSERVIPTAQIAGLPDPQDAPFLETTKAAGTVLVTGNLKHFPARLRSGVTVETPSEFMKRFEIQAPDGQGRD